ncbi:MAG: tripartite tricarboxylate transporter substrate binding protein [Pigmentiphaga sp.]|nr:tripartite tricarboxylate transporter substrate binding protein [Pigmentiphaga sp.]
MIRTAALGTLLALTALTTPASAQNFPEAGRQLSMLTPFPPGSTSDILPRLLVPHLSKSLGINVIVENRPGANGSLGAARVAGQPADGYSLLMATTGVLAINPWVYDKLSYDPAKDFTPVINAAITPNLLVAHPDLPANNLKELIALARKEPGKLTFASAGNGSTSHLCGESLKATANVDLVHVPYQGPAPAIQDVLAGRVSLMCDNFSNVINHVKSGSLKAIVLTSNEKTPLAPEIPTSAEEGYPELLAGNWYSFVAPAGTPAPVVERLNKDIAAALAKPEVTERLNSLGLKVVADSPEAFKKFIAEESARMKVLVEKSGAKIN